jgi:ATP/maltotriose-dependent transcriptional regulator MalT
VARLSRSAVAAATAAPRGGAARCNPEIAQQLCLSNHTVKSHINRIFAKTSSRDRAAAINYAHHHQLV